MDGDLSFFDVNRSSHFVFGCFLYFSFHRCVTHARQLVKTKSNANLRPMYLVWRPRFQRYRDGQLAEVQPGFIWALTQLNGCDAWDGHLLLLCLFFEPFSNWYGTAHHTFANQLHPLTLEMRFCFVSISIRIHNSGVRYHITTSCGTRSDGCMALES